MARGFGARESGSRFASNVLSSDPLIRRTEAAGIRMALDEKFKGKDGGVFVKLTKDGKDFYMGADGFTPNKDEARAMHYDIHEVGDQVEQIADRFGVRAEVIGSSEFKGGKNGEGRGFGASESVDFVSELMSLGLTRDEAMREIREMMPKAKISAPKQDVAVLKDKVKEMTLSDIAKLIKDDWSSTKKGVYFGAQPYLDAMGGMGSVDDNYGQDSGKEIVTYLLGNAQSWRGDVAKVVKAELKRRLKD